MNNGGRTRVSRYNEIPGQRAAFYSFASDPRFSMIYDAPLLPGSIITRSTFDFSLDFRLFVFVTFVEASSREFIRSNRSRYFL